MGPTISDPWEGLDEFFELGDELLVARDREDVLRYVRDIPLDEARQIGEAARQRVLGKHTAKHRAFELEGYLFDLLGNHVAAEIEPAESHQTLMAKQPIVLRDGRQTPKEAYGLRDANGEWS